MTDKAAFLSQLSDTLAGLERDGLFKRERMITGAQGAHVRMEGRDLLNLLLRTTTLALRMTPRLVAAAEAAMRGHGYGMASVRFICGTQDLHRELERRLASFLGRRTRSCSRPVSMRMAVCSSRFWGRRTRSSRTR